jgi:hypothetical protein
VWPAAALGVALILVSIIVYRPYPGIYHYEDVRPLAGIIERQIQPGDEVFVYSGAHFLFALYTHWPVSFHRSTWFTNSFAVDVHRAGVHMLAPRGVRPDEYEVLLEEAASSHHRIWLISAHERKDYRGLLKLLADSGYARAQSFHTRAAALALWAPPAGR